MSPRPQLVMGENNKVCMQVRVGQFTATLPLPEEMATYTEEQLQPFFDRVVPEMLKNLFAMQRKHNRKLRKKACRSGSTKSSPMSGEKTLKLLPQP